MKRTLFIDRDGTILAEPADEQIDSYEKFEFVPGAISALKFLAEHTDYQLVMVSNQDGLGTSCYPESDFWPTHNLMLNILKVVVVPVIAGGIVHALLKKPFDAHKAAFDRILSILSMTGICFTILALVAPSRETFARAGLALIAAAVLHNLSGYALGYWSVRLLGRWTGLGETDARTVAIEVGMQNSGMASALAVGVLGSATIALPANIFSVWMNFSGSVLASIFARTGRTEALQRKEG